MGDPANPVDLAALQLEKVLASVEARTSKSAKKRAKSKNKPAKAGKRSAKAKKPASGKDSTKPAARRDSEKPDRPVVRRRQSVFHAWKSKFDKTLKKSMSVNKMSTRRKRNDSKTK